ncbi:CopD family protein [Algiphilus sp.]|uniref:CopD family protein n=1 Tax=Algiphilus sp. TaxID=1872431 RepID=UPI003B51BC83
MLWLKALHLIFMVTWFAGLFYLPRIYVYLAETQEPAVRPTLHTMARRLYAIMTIGMVATWLFGLALLVWNPGYLSQGWIHAKLTLLVLLSGYHGWLKVQLRQFLNGTSTKSGKFWRIANEVPALFLVGIILLAVLRPF